jgi:DNA-binding transcriptional ArsR family regulator
MGNDMPEIDGAAMLRALAEEDALLVFAAVIEATGTGSAARTRNTIGVTWTTLGGVSRRTGLPEPAVVNALKRLTQAHLIAASPAGDGWHTDFSSLCQAATPPSS